MWQKKRFTDERTARAWIAKNAHRYQCELIFGNNCMFVEYRPLRRM